MAEMNLTETNMLIFIKCQKNDDNPSCTVALQSLSSASQGMLSECSKGGRAVGVGIRHLS